MTPSSDTSERPDAVNDAMDVIKVKLAINRVMDVLMEKKKTFSQSVVCLERPSTRRISGLMRRLK